MDLSHELYPEIFNSIPEHIAILDEFGTIQVVNSAWESYALQNGGIRSQIGIGNNYLQICDQSKEMGSLDAEMVGAGLRQVLKGSSESFYYEYPCPSPTEKIWYLVKCWPMSWDGSACSIVFHQEITQPRLLQETLQSQALTDPLCQIANRRHFDNFLKQEWQRDMRTGTPLSLVIIDIDFFKLYNDHYGHTAGDDCLKRVAHLLDSFAKRPGDLTARYGGDEFMLVLGNTSIDAATEIAHSIAEAIRAINIDHEKSTISSTITASLGVSSMIPKGGYSESLLVPMADDALYRAKKNGRNSVAQ